jgi:hypothetical protein
MTEENKPVPMTTSEGLIDHRHNGFDSSPVNYKDLVGKPAQGVIVATRDCSVASGAVNYAHGLKVIPSWINVHASWGYTIGSNTFSPMYYCVGKFINGGAQKCIYTGEQGGLNSHAIQRGAQTTEAIFIYDQAIGSGGTQAGVISVNSTNIIVTWTKVGTPTVTADLLFDFGA